MGGILLVKGDTRTTSCVVTELISITLWSSTKVLPRHSIFYILSPLALYKVVWCVGQHVLFWIVGAHVHVLLHDWVCLIRCIALGPPLIILPELSKGNLLQCIEAILRQ